MAMGPLVRSRFLVRVPRADGDTTFFHSLFGTSLVLDRTAERLLDTFRTPTTVTRPTATLRTLAERRFLVDATLDERAEFVRAMRPQACDTGAHLQALVLLAAEQCNLACP